MALPLVQLCKMVLPDMRARGRGLVVNIGSATASLMQEAPLLQGKQDVKKSGLR